MKGNDLIITAGSVIYASKTCDVATDVDTKETASPTSATWRTYLAGRKGWTVSVGYLVADNKWSDDLLHVGQTVTLQFKNRGDSTASMSGTAIVTQCRVTATRGNLAQGSFTFLGTGELSKT